MANWLTFEKIQHWDYLFFPGFQYDIILDEHIEVALADIENLVSVKPEIDWEDDRWLRENKSIPEERKHAYRVAALVKAFRDGNLLKKGISLDTFCVRDCRSCVSNGHHRVRALQFLGLPAGPFWLSGLVDPLKELVELAGTQPPAEASYFCDAALLALYDDDIQLTR
jgi:hypothetical protein